MSFLQKGSLFIVLDHFQFTPMEYGDKQKIYSTIWLVVTKPVTDKQLIILNKDFECADFCGV